MDFVAEILFDERTYLKLVRELESRTGVVLEGYRRGVAQRRISRRIRQTGCSTLREYLSYLRRNSSEAEELARFVTLPVGRFFRNREVFDVVKKEALPIIFDAARPGEKLFAWSAGCGEGEEAYSLAMILTNSFVKEMRQNPFSITGTDVNSAAIEKARSARYESSQLEEAPIAIKKRCFVRREKYWEVKDVVRELVKFKRQSLPSGRGITLSNLIMMRNLLIYYDRDHQEAFVTKVTLCLKPGGILVLGKSETLPAGFRDRFETISSHNRIYRKAS